MKAEELSEPVVRAVVTAMRDGDRKAFFAAFAPSAVLTDDGHPQPLADWADREIFRAHGCLEVEKQDRGGLELVGPSTLINGTWRLYGSLILSMGACAACLPSLSP